ncbi:YcxB family protein [Pararhizobium sp. BT-229]|uniref:YcxB family protein n=1 Tax=Pararhizobium sp. BT-229 TaxID=2986923 RepID=UPI0021F77B16|nr:YcxB family protein [Pararhizobium sp. BT-229]MCV9962251.1 YcxB family protein [Pararhizobium sp. BT-229]
MEKLLSATRAGGNWRLEFRANKMEVLVASEVVWEISAEKDRDYLDRFFVRIRNSFLYFYYVLFLCFVSLMTMLVLYSVLPKVGKADFILRFGIFALISIIAHFVLKIYFKISLRHFGKGSDVTCDIDFQSLTYNGGGQRIEIQWQEVTEVRETENYLMIFAGPEAQIALPKRVFGSEKKLLKFRMFCGQALENAQGKYAE